MLKPNKTLTIILFVLLIFVAMSGRIIAQQNDSEATSTAEIVKARDYATEYVAMAKESLAKDSSGLLQARKLYIDAYANYDAWVVYMRTAIEDGRTKRLGNDPDYRKISADASAAGSKFIAFVDLKTGETKAVNVLISSIGALGLQLWNGVADRHQQERCIASANLDERTRWFPWEAITEDTLKNPPKSSQATPSEKCRPSAAGNTSGKDTSSDASKSSKTPNAKKPQNPPN